MWHISKDGTLSVVTKQLGESSTTGHLSLKILSLTHLKTDTTTHSQVWHVIVCNCCLAMLVESWCILAEERSCKDRHTSALNYEYLYGEG